MRRMSTDREVMRVEMKKQEINRVGLRGWGPNRRNEGREIKGAGLRSDGGTAVEQQWIGAGQKFKNGTYMEA